MVNFLLPISCLHILVIYRQRIRYMSESNMYICLNQCQKYDIDQAAIFLVNAVVL